MVSLALDDGMMARYGIHRNNQVVIVSATDGERCTGNWDNLRVYDDKGISTIVIHIHKTGFVL